MKIALVAPPYPLSEAPSPPLGLSYVAAACRMAGAEVRIFDYIVSAYNKEKLGRQIAEFSPDIIGAGSVTMNFNATLQILADAKEIKPEIITMMGGSHTSFYVLETLRENPFMDIVLCGEAEATLMELTPLLREPSRWDGVKGIAFRRAGEVLQNPPRELIADIDSIPLPARDLLPLARYKALGFPISMLTSRGCPYQCIFCQGRRLVGAHPRLRSPEIVVDEMEAILALGFERINIADDLFMIEPKRARQICEEIIKRGLKFVWSAFVRANTVDLETLRLMKSAGCDSVSFGVESGDEQILREIKKGITLEMARRATEICQQAGLVVLVSFIAGLPGETLESLERTKQFADSLGCHYGFHILAPFPGTTLRENVAKYDLEILTNDWSRYDANQAVARTSALDAGQIEAFVRDFEESLHGKWQEHLHLWRKGINPPDIEMQVEGHQRMHFIFRLLSDDLLEYDSSKGFDGLASADYQGDSLGNIYDYLSTATGFERAFVYEVMEGLIARGLVANDADGNLRWK